MRRESFNFSNEIATPIVSLKVILCVAITSFFCLMLSGCVPDENKKIMNNEVEQVFKDAGVVYAVLADKSGSVWEEYGDSRKLEHSGIVDQYIPNSSAVTGLLDFLEGQIIPQMVGQGKVLCVLSKPDEQHVLLMFLHDESDVMIQSQLAQDLHDSFMKYF